MIQNLFLGQEHNKAARKDPLQFILWQNLILYGEYDIVLTSMYDKMTDGTTNEKDSRANISPCEPKNPTNDQQQ